MIRNIVFSRVMNLPKQVACIDYMKFHYVKSLYAWVGFPEIREKAK